MAIWILELTSMHKQLTDITYDKITYGTLLYTSQNRLIRNIFTFPFGGELYCTGFGSNFFLLLIKEFSPNEK